MNNKRKKYKSIRYTDEERMMFNDSIEAFMLRLKRNPVANVETSWNTIIRDTQKVVPKKFIKEEEE